MKFFIKNKSYIISGLILAFIIVGTTFYVSGKEFTEEKWLEKNSVSLDVKDNNDFSSFGIFKNDLEDYDVFFTGEFHGVGINEAIDLKFLKFFKEKAGVNYYLVEESPCQAYFLNKYLETGDEAFLNKTGGMWVKEMHDKWTSIYEFNKQLPQEGKIKILGIDIYENSKIYSEFLNDIISNKAAEKEVESSINEFLGLCEKLKEESFPSYRSQKEIVSKFKKDIEFQKDIYEKYLGDDFKLFTYVLDNFYYCIEWNMMARKSNEGLDYREEKIYENFKRLYSELPKGKYYGHFGNLHTYQSGYNLGNFMNGEDSPVKNRVLSIATIYENCYGRQHINDRYLIPSPNSKLIDLIEPYKKSDLMLYKLIGEKSPFYKIKDSKYFNETPYPEEFEENFVTNYFQYLIVVYDAKEMTPIENFRFTN